MISLLEKSFSYQLDYLEKYIQENYSCQSPESAFANYILYCTFSKVQFNLIPDPVVININEDINKWSQAHVLSVIGYEIASGKSFPQEVLLGWKEGFNRLSKRQVFPSDRNTFFYRPIELLGIVLGAINLSSIENDKNLIWLKETFIKGENKLEKHELWTFIIGFYASHILDISWKTNPLPFFEDINIDNLALIKWLYSINPSIAECFGITEYDKDKINKILLERCLTTSLNIQDVSHAAILYFAIRKTVFEVFQSSCNKYVLVDQTPKLVLELVSSISDRLHSVTRKIQDQNWDYSDLENINDKDIGQYIKNLESLKLNSQLIIDNVQYIIEKRNHSKLVIMNNPQITNIKNQQNIQAPVHGVVAGNIEGNQNNFVQEPKQNLAEFAAEIQQLLDQVQQSQNIPVQDAQFQVAKELVAKANNDAIWKGQFIQFGQSMGDLATKTTVSEVVKGVIKIAFAALFV